MFVSSLMCREDDGQTNAFISTCIYEVMCDGALKMAHATFYGRFNNLRVTDRDYIHPHL